MDDTECAPAEVTVQRGNSPSAQRFITAWGVIPEGSTGGCGHKRGTSHNWVGEGRLSGNGTPNGIPTHMHNSRDSTRRLSRAMPSGCTSLPESPAARCSVCRARRIFCHASASSGTASDPPTLLQEPAFPGRLSQKTNSKLFCQSKLWVSHPSPGATTLPEQLWLTPPRTFGAHWQGTFQHLLCSKESDLLPGGKLEGLASPLTALSQYAPNPEMGGSGQAACGSGVWRTERVGSAGLPP